MKRKIKGYGDIDTYLAHQINCIHDIDTLSNLSNKLNSRISEVSKAKEEDIYNHPSIKQLLKLSNKLYENRVININITCKCQVSLWGLCGKVKIDEIQLEDNPENWVDVSVANYPLLKNHKQFIEFYHRYVALYQKLIKDIKKVAKELDMDEDEIKDIIDIH